MFIKTITKKDTLNLLKKVSKTWDTYVPQKNEAQDVFLEILPKEEKHLENKLKNICLEDANITISQKDKFFPQIETLFEFNNKSIKENIKESRKLLFGVKACDIKAMHFVDDFFKCNIPDIYYLSKIKDRLTVVIGCLKPPREKMCFCTSTDTGPFLDSGFDLQLIEDGDSFFVEIGSSEGEKFCLENKEFFKDISNDVTKTLKDIKRKAKDALDLKVDFDKVLDIMSKDDKVPQQIYKNISKTCINCGGCVYVCPTCTCFNVIDDKIDDSGFRMRNWDTCLFKGFTNTEFLIAARRYEHKLKYDYKETNTSSCVGCGRCLFACPVNLGMSKFINEVVQYEK